MAAFPPPRRKNKVSVIGLGPQCYIATGFFDGAATSIAEGVGAVLYISHEHHFLIRLGCGISTNSKTELLALFCLLHVANVMGLPGILVYGDSMMVIDWAKGKSKLNVTNLEHWCNRTAELVHGFSSFGCQHIYHEHNQLVDRLSKEALSLTVGNLNVQEFMEGQLTHEVTMNLFFQ